MTALLKKYISCAVFCSVLLGCTGCEIEPADSPDTIEGILHINSPKQETVTETQALLLSDAETTEYQSIFFPDVTETQPETATEPETEPESETTAPTDPPTEPTTEPVPETTALPEMPVIPAIEWEQAYRTFLKNESYQKLLGELTQENDVRFLLLYLNDDDIPELMLQTLSKVIVYTYQNYQVMYIDDFSTSRYSYEFYYRPYHSMIAESQGSVMSDGTYWEVREYEADSGLSLKTEYCYPVREYSYELYAEQGMNIDLEYAPVLDVHPERKRILGSSWICVPDMITPVSTVPRYEITDENIESLFGTEEEQEPTEMTGA